ncbi:unnamed protein product [Closterium sp. NIES-54]
MCIDYRALNKQTALTTAPVLILPDLDRNYVVEADASDRAVGAVLMQHHERSLQPITYLSKKLLQWEKDLAVRKGSGKIWVPNYAPLRQILLEEFHDIPYTGHFGSNKTLAGIAKYYYWPGMAADVQQFVTSCDTCQRMKSSKQKKTGLLQPLLVPEQPWQVVSLDFITGLPSTSRGHDSILVVIDKFCKMGHFIPTNATATAEATARLFFDRIITIHGIPATLISDRDPKFTSKFWKELMGLLGTKLAMSLPYHPQTDGQTERLNQVVEQLLRTACKDDVSHWDTQLPTLEFAYNNASHAATGKTPFFLCYGREPLTPQQPTTPAHVQAAHDFVTTMQQLWEKTQRRLTTMQTSLKQYADRQRRDHSVAVGDQVLLDTRNLNLSHLPSKLRPRFYGPFLVEAQFSSRQPTPLSTSHSLSAPPSDESVEPSGPYPELLGCLMYLMTCTRPDLAYPLGLLAHYVAPGRHRNMHMDAAKRVLRYLCSTSGIGLVLGGRGDVVLTSHSDASWVDEQATQRSSHGYTFSLGSGSVSWRSTRSSSVLGSSCEAEIYATAMAAQELRWLTYLLTDLEERPRSPPVLYVDNKAMLALCQEHRREHITKHIALRYFLARELQQHGQLRLAYVATRANTTDIFTKALPSGDHQRFCTLLGLVPTLPHLL